MNILRCNSLADGKGIQPLRHFQAFQFKVRTHEAGEQTVILHIHLPVHDDHRDPGILCFPEHRVPSGLRHRCQHDVVHLLLDKGSDGPDLVGLLLLTILEDQVVPGLFCKGTFHGLRVGTAPVGFRSHLGKSHHNTVCLCILWCCNILRSALSVAASCKQDSQPQQQTRHPSSSCSAFLHICNVILFCHTSRPEIALSFSHFPAGSFSV